jgi:hypothetical protein
LATLTTQHDLAGDPLRSGVGAYRSHHCGYAGVVLSLLDEGSHFLSERSILFHSRLKDLDQLPRPTRVLRLGVEPFQGFPPLGVALESGTDGVIDPGDAGP